MLTKFYFKNFEPNPVIRDFAHITLTGALDEAPYDSTGVALIEKQDNDYRCTFDIYSIQGPLSTSALGPCAKDAVEAAAQKLKNKLRHWRQNGTHCAGIFFENGQLDYKSMP